MSSLVLSVDNCIHCGSPIQNSAAIQSTEKFCCSGCRFVYQFMYSEGLTKFYELRDANPPLLKRPVRTSESTFDDYDEPEFLAAKAVDGKRVRFFLKGMDCSACVWLLEKLPEYCHDAKSARVNLANSTIDIEKTPDGKFSEIARNLNHLGYKPHLLHNDESSSRLQTREQREGLIRIGVAGALTGNIMILTVSIYGGASGLLERQFHWLSALLALPVLSYCAWPFYQSAFYSLRARRLNIDVPIVIALLAGFTTSAMALRHETSATYFDSLSMLVFLLLGSRYFLRSLQKRHSQATNIEDDLLTGSVNLVTPEGQRKANASSLNPGDHIRIKPGSLIPIDGVVESGSATISAAILTGESTNIRIAAGSIVEAGYRFIQGDAVLRVVNRTRQTRLAGILRDAESLSETKSQFVHLADRVAQYFIATVLLSAVAVFAVFATSDPAEGLSRALALIIVTCPCVFGIAIPLSMAVALRRAAKKGIIIKSADAIEQLWKAKTFFFDKTGTLTEGSMEVIRALPTDVRNLQIVYGLEKDQNHPVGRTLTQFASASRKQNMEIENVTPLDAGGVVGSFEGATYKLRPVRFETDLKDDSSFLISKFELLKDDNFVTDFTLGDKPRADANPVLRALRDQGCRTVMLSGDRKPAVEICANKLGFARTDVFSEMTPEAKVSQIRQTASPSVMVGDGANDAAAFAAASVGIAVYGSLDVSLRSADVYLTRPDLRCLPELLHIARGTKSAIVRNLAFSATFNIAAGTLAALGLMTPLWAAVLMPLSSLIVLISASWEGAS